MKTILACWLSVAAACCFATAQDSSPNPVAPADPNQFMRAASEAMSLTASDMKPWHLKAHYGNTTPDGVKHEGVFEEWWASPEKYKVSYTSADFARTHYRVGKDTFATSKGVVPFPAVLVSSLLVHPLPLPALLDMLAYTSKEVTLAGNKLVCYPGTYRNIAPERATTMYCFSKALPVARVVVEPFGNQTTFNQVVRIHGHYVARQIRWTNPKANSAASVDVDRIDPQLGVDEAALVPPADAVLLAPQKISVSSGVAAGNLLNRIAPVYPIGAKQMHVEGIVIVKAMIGKDGTMQNVQAVSGPLILQQSALDAVRAFRYQPYLLEGMPVEVETTVNVIYQLERKPDSQ